MSRPLARLRVGFGRNHTLGSILASLASIHGTTTMYEEHGGNGPVSYRSAADQVERWAAAIHARIAPGDRVVLATTNGYAQFLLSLAVCRAGGIAVPVNPHMSEHEVDHVIADAAAALVLRSASELPDAPPQRWTAGASPGDVAALFYTSGTTGKPKGVELTHRGLLGSGPRSALVNLPLRHDEAVLALPVAHIMGFVALLGCACAGVPAYSFERFSPTAVLDAIERRRASMFVGVPAMYRLLIEAGAERRDLTCVRVWASGADVMPDDLARRFQQMGAIATLPGVGPVGDALFVEGYGMAELAGAVAVRVAPPVRIPLLERLLPGDALGQALPGYRLKIVDEDGNTARPGATGELWVKGPGVTVGYWGNEAASADALTGDGWLRTGDLAAKGPFGTIRFAGRAKDVIKHGGYSVYALEVEAALVAHPAVAEAAVLGLPDEMKGEVPVAVVRLVADAGPEVDPAVLMVWAAERLADYKCPRQIVIVDDLPRTGSAKVRKAELRALFVD